MTPHQACPMTDSSQVGDARRRAARLADSLGFDEVAAGRLALVVTELASNLSRHARDGTLLIGTHRGEHGVSVELVSLDHGPGMRDVEAFLADGMSTGGTPGTGLGAVRRLANQFFAFSKPAQGTIVVARVAPDSRAGPFRTDPARKFSHGGLAVALTGETVSGDAWSCGPTERGVAVIVADGLGHGPQAAAASDEAARVFDRAPSAGPRQHLAASHAALSGTRGAAIAVADLDLANRRLAYAGVGNISGRLITGLQDRSLLSQHGTIGLRVRRFEEVGYEVPLHAMLVMHSDGIVARWSMNEAPELLTCEAIVIAAFLIRDHLRGRDDATVVVVRIH